MFKALIAFSITFISPLALANTGAPVSKSRLQSLVADFYASQTKSAQVTSMSVPSADMVKLFGNSNPHHNGGDCNDDQNAKSCTDVACDHLGAYGCDDMNEIKAVGAACAGNRNGNCLQAMCNHLGAYGCDDMGEIQQVAQACRGGYNGDCIEAACSHLGAYGCDDMSEAVAVAQLCKGVDADCITSTCNRLGAYGCDDMSEMKAVGDACRGE